MTQQQQSKLGNMKPMKVGSIMKTKPAMSQRDMMAKHLRDIYKNPKASFGKGFGGEPTIKKAPKKMNSKPSKAMVQKSLKKTMGY